MFTKQPSTSPHRFLFLVVFALVFLVPVVTVVAQADPPVRTSPTQAPTVTTGAFQANPTQPPEPDPIDDIQANPTNTPTPRPPRGPDEVQANPTDVPERDIDDVVANPTEAPQREIDDVVANPTEAPAIDDEAIPTTGTVRVIKLDCPLGIVEDAFLSDYLTICTENHDGVEFVLNDVDGAQLGVTNGGVVEWTGVDPGVFNITETMPAGYGDPIVFCGYTESPGGGVQHPSRQESAGGIVAGTFPDATFEFVCYWMNLKATGQVIPGADDIASREERGTADFLLMKHVCPNDIPPGQGPAYYVEHCAEVVDGIEFTVSHGNGGSTKPVSGGTAEWSGIPLGPFTVDEDVPVQFGEPIVFCGWTAIYEGIVYDAFAQLTPSTGGVVELEASIPGAYHFCYYFNVKGVGDLVDPDSVANNLVTRKWTCPDGTSQNQRDRDYYFQRCEQLLEPVEFTVSSATGDDTKATAGGFAEWVGLPLGEFTLTESILSGYGAPVVFCGWYAEWGGFHYDAFPQLVILAIHNVYEGEITIPNTDYFCDVFNIEGEIDDFQANPTEAPGIDDFQGNATAGTMRLVKRSCPLGVVETATLAEYLTLCPQLHDGVDFTLETAAGIGQDTTAMGQAQWTGVPAGAFELQEDIPAGYKDPIVFCGYTESPGGGVQHPALQESTGGLVEGAFPENTIFEYVCYWMNLKATGQVGTGPGSVANPGGEGGASVVVVKKRTCPFGTPLDLEMSAYAEQCTGELDGVQFTVSHANGSSTKPTDDGEAQWQALPLGPFTVQEAIPGGYGEPVTTCFMVAFADGGDWVLGTYFEARPAPDGLIAIELDPPDDLDLPEIESTHTTCTAYNMPLSPGSIAQAEDLTNTLLVRKWICPGSTIQSDDLYDMQDQCEFSAMPVEVTLTNDDGESTQATDPAWTQWGDVPLGEFTLQETIPDGFGEPIAFCGWTAFYEGAIYDSFPHPVPSPGGLVEGQITVPNTSYFCDLFNIATGTAIGGPGSVTANPPDESNTLVAHKWSCAEGTAADAHLLDYFEQCQPATEPVEFTLANADGDSTQATEGGTATWEDVPLGPFTLQEQVPAGYEVLVVWCGWTAFYNGAVYDAFHQPVTVEDGLVEGEISVPNTHYLCHFMNVPVSIDDFQANPTEADEIDDVVANPTEAPGIDDVQANPTEAPNAEIDDVTANPGPASLLISLAECHSDSIPGDDIYNEDVEFFSEWCDWFTTEFEFTVSSEGGFSESHTTSGFGLTFAEVPVAAITITETIPIGWDDPMALCWSDQVDPAGWHIGNDVAWNVVSGEQIECLWVNVTGSVAPFVRADAKLCPPGFDTDVAWMDVFQGCNLPIDGVEFTFTDANGSSTQPLSGQWVQWNQAGIGEGQTVELAEDFPAGYTDPLVLCSSWPVEAGDPFDWYYEPVAATGGTISVTPNLDEGDGPLGVIPQGEGYDCKFFHFAVDGFAGADDFQANPTDAPGTVIDDIQANPTQAPTEEPIDDLQANPTEAPGILTVRTWVCPAFYDPLVGSPLDDCTESLNGITFDLVNHAEGQPDFQATTGDAIDGAAVFEPQPGTYSLKEQLPDGYGVPFLWNCTGLTNIPDDLEPPLSTINFFRIVIASGQVIACDWMNVPAGAGFGGPDDLQANPTEAAGIDDVQANPVDPTHVVTVGNLACPAGVDPTEDYWVAVTTECDEPLASVAFTLTTDDGPVEDTTGGVTDAIGGTVWLDVDLGDSGEIQIREDIPDGYGEPEVWCVSYPEVEVADPFDLEFVQYEAGDGLITAIPEQHEPYRFGCVFFNIVADDPESGGTILSA